MITLSDHPLAVGRTAEIYAWEPGSVVKLYHDWFSDEAIEYEARIARAVHAAGVPTPAAGEIIQVNGRRGLVYERVEGESLLAIIRRQPWRTPAIARLLAELQFKMHQTALPALPSQRRRLQDKLKAAQALPPELKQVALQALEGLPDSDRVCHGDFHPDNVLLTAGGPLVIDWIDATSGEPMADLARTVLLTRYGALPPGALGALLQILRRVFYRAYMVEYSRHAPGCAAEVRRWLPVIAAARLSENIPSEENTLLSIARKAFA